MGNHPSGRNPPGYSPGRVPVNNQRTPGDIHCSGAQRQGVHMQQSAIDRCQRGYRSQRLEEAPRDDMHLPSFNLKRGAAGSGGIRAHFPTVANRQQATVDRQEAGTDPSTITHAAGVADIRGQGSARVHDQGAPFINTNLQCINGSGIGRQGSRCISIVETNRIINTRKGNPADLPAICAGGLVLPVLPLHPVVADRAVKPVGIRHRHTGHQSKIHPQPHIDHTSCHSSFLFIPQRLIDTGPPALALYGVNLIRIG